MLQKPTTLDEAALTAYLLARAVPNPSRIASRAAAGPLSPLVRRPRLVAARASAGVARKGPRRSLGALDRADRRRQNAGRILGDAGGIERGLSFRAVCSTPPAKRRGGGGGGGALHPPPFLPPRHGGPPPPPPPPPPPSPPRGG